MESQKDQVQKILDEEGGLERGLNTAQITMIAIGGAIGTGLFLGSGWAISYAGPAVIISYMIGAIIAFLLMGCLAEMSVATPTTGALGFFADTYINQWAGFTVRWNWWLSLTIGVGGDLTAVAIYMKYWFPSSQGWIWIVLVASILIFINFIGVKWFGEFEFWFSAIKVFAIIAFIGLAVYVIFFTGTPDLGPQNLVNNGGFAPKGLWGIWVAVFVAVFSYLGIEMIAVAAGEAKNPDKDIPRALKSTVFRLVVFYLITIALMMMIVPWQDAGVVKSPFVQVLEMLNIPYAAGIMNFVIIMAAASSINSAIYIATRNMFSLSVAGYAPKALSKLSKKKIPLRALIVSSAGILVGVICYNFIPGDAYMTIMSMTMFGAVFNWIMVFVSHYFFRKKWEKSGGRKLPVRMIGYPYLTILGMVMLIALLLTTLFVPDFRLTLIAGAVWIALCSIGYLMWKKANPDKVRME